MKKILLALCVTFSGLAGLQANEEVFAKLEAISEASLPLMESAVFNLINQQRVANSLQPLRWASSPAHLAREHSLNMASGLVPFSHQGFDKRYNILRAKIPSLTRCGENVAYNFGFSNPATQAVQGWLASPGHYANIMGDYNLAGIGVAKNLKGEYYFTQIFVKADIASLNALEGSDELFNGIEACINDTSMQVDTEY